VVLFQDGDYVEVRSPHGECELPVKIGKIGKGQIFVPFHFGSVVDNCEGGRASTANELTQPTWDRYVARLGPVLKTRHSTGCFVMQQLEATDLQDRRCEDH
jgi:anaerobic selenocysteine-containing dehydrogenase